MQGNGVVEEIRHDGTIIFILNNWELAYNSKVKCYLNVDAVKLAAVKPAAVKLADAQEHDQEPAVEVVSSPFKVGEKVKSIYGSGIVEEIRNDGTVIFILNNWELAYGSKVKCYLNADAVKVRGECRDWNAVTGMP